MKNKRFLAGVLFFGLLFAAAWISGSIRTEQPCRNARYAYPEPPAMCNGKKITSADISFRFKATGENKEYNNLFQTAPENEGLRLEWTTLGARPLALVAGTEQGLYGLDLGFTPVLNRWHKARIEMRGTRLTVWLDDVLRTQTDVPGLNPKFTDVAAGTGFSRTRPFQGEIKDFSLKLRRGTHKTDAWQFFALQGLFLLLFFGLARRLFAGETRRKNRPGIWLKPVVFCLGAGLVLGQLWPLSFPPRFEPSAPLVWWELTLLLCAASGAVWKKLGLKNFGAVLAVFGLFYFLKKPFLPVSFPGLASDFALLLMWVFLARTLLGFARSAVSKFFTRAGICAAAATVFFLLSTASLYLRKIHYSGFKLDEMSALFQSNLRESAEFFTSFFSLGDMLLIAFGAAAGGYLFLRAARAKTVPPRTVTFYGAACAGMLVISAALCWWAGPAQSFFMPFSYAMKDYKRIAGEYRHYQQLRQSMAPVHAEKTEKGETYVLIIGEASNRLHWGAYGYFRDTTPWASAQKQRPDVLTFTNAYSSYVHTVPSLAKALTSSNQYNGEYEFAAPSLIEAAKAAGFKTFWLSNQDKISLVDNPLTILAQSADRVRFTNAFRFAGDEALMPYIDETLREMNPQDNNLLIIHLAGSHAEYKQRLPKNYDISFPGGEEYLGNPARRPDFVKNVLDPYDSTLRYTDEILSQLYERVWGFGAPVKAMLYISDHGEDVYGERFHNSAIFSYEMARIPMMLWVSDAYAARYPAVLQRLRARQNNVFTLDLLFNAFLSLAGVSAPVNQPQYDFTSPEYMLTWQNALTLKTDNQRLQTDLYIPEEPRPLADDPYYLRKKNLEEAGKRFPKEKFIALHADALGAAFEAADAGFGGLEINVTAPGLQMGHGPEHVYPMTLAEYLEKSPQEKFQKIWLDVKLLDENNARETLNRLNALDKKYRLKERVVVETPLRSDSLKEFAQDGWKTSLYLFHNEPAKSDILQNAELARQYARQTANTVKTQQNAAVSFSQEVYPFVKQYLEPLLAPSVSYHTWMPDSLPPVTDRTWTDAVKQFAVIKDPRVQTVMIMPQSKFAISL